MTFEQFFNFIESKKCFDYHDVSYIDTEGKQHYIDQSDYYLYQININRLLAEGQVTLKIEQMEKHWKFDDRTIHLFYNPKFGPTFEKHTDPVDVIIECKAGSKSMWVDGIEVILTPGDKLSIREGTEHKALNYERALIASHAIGDTETLNRIRENNGDLQPQL